MGKTTKDTVKALKKASRKNNPIPKAKVIPNKKRKFKEAPDITHFDDIFHHDDDWWKDK